MPIMRSGSAPRGRAMTAGRSMVGARRFAEGGTPENYEQKVARRANQGKEGQQARRAAAEESSREARERLRNPIGSVIDAGKRIMRAMKPESKEMVKKEISFMKKKGAPKSMIEHEKKEAKGMRKGGKCYAKGGMVGRGDGVASKGKTRCKVC